MEDLIYGLLVFAWVAYGLYKGFNKKKMPSQKTNPQNQHFHAPAVSEKRPDFEAIFNQLFDLPTSQHDKISHPYETKPEVKKPKTPVYSEKHAKPVTLDSYSGTDHISSSLKYAETAMGDSESIYKPIDYQYEYEQEAEPVEGIDLRQAVIHQAILNRPY